MKGMSLKGKIILSVISGVAFCGGVFYFALPAINPMSPSFWSLLAFVFASFAYPFLFKEKSGEVKKEKSNRIIKFKLDFGGKKLNLAVALLIVVPLVILLLGNVISSEVFNAKGYASVIEVTVADFATDMKETGEVTNIALMDGESAKIIGNRTLGNLSEVVSQYEISGVYTQINYQYSPKKVANLEYADFFKWFANMDKGVPGYVMVDPVNNTAEYVELEKPLRYVESGYFGDDLMRKVRFAYPTKIFDDFISFEVDDEGNPFYIISCLKPKVFPFGAMDVSEVIIFDPCTGESEIYDVADVPAWVDAVYSGGLAEQKYNWHGTLSGGFINSIIGNKDCKRTTDDYGYITIGDDVWYFTGVTSISSDESNIGFIISNARTGEYKFYPVIGAEEYSAMGAAEGEVQEKGYDASFPALVNIAGEPTYIMVLKDANQLVKLYALVNVEQYNLVATGETQASAISAYIKLLSQNGVDTSTPPKDDALISESITVADVQVRALSGVTYYYLTSDAGKVYRVEFNEENEAIFFVKAGSRMKLQAILNEKTGIYSVSEWEFTEEVSK